jgi:antitoxin ChpS
MHATTLRKVGGSVMLAVPPALLDVLQLRPGAKVGIAVESGRLVVEPRQRPRYTLNELLARCDPKARPGDPKPRRPRQERVWLEGKPVGRELV